MCPIYHPEQQHRLDPGLGGIGKASVEPHEQALYRVDDGALFDDDLGAPIGRQAIELVEEHLLAVCRPDVVRHEAVDQRVQKDGRGIVARHDLFDVAEQLVDVGGHHGVEHVLLGRIVVVEERLKRSASGKNISAVRKYSGSPMGEPVTLPITVFIRCGVLATRGRLGVMADTCWRSRFAWSTFFT